MNPYEQIFEGYLAELRAAHAAASGWWATLLAQEAARGANAADAEAAVDARWPMGPVSHPAVIATFRKWALECQRLNDAAGDGQDEEDDDDEDEADDDGRWGEDDPDEPADEDLGALEGPVEPRDLLIDMLAQRAEDMAEFMADFVFTPLGLDADDRWI